LESSYGVHTTSKELPWEIEINNILLGKSHYIPWLESRKGVHTTA